MIELRKPEDRITGWKVLVYADTECGKTMFGLSVPKSIIVDSEDGTSHYQEEMDNVKYVVNTSSTKDLMGMFDMLEDDEDLINEMQSLVIDSKTNFYSSQQITSLEVEIKRAKKKGRDTDDSGISVKQWGRIKLDTKRLQALTIDLASRGKYIIDLAQEAEVTKDIGNGNRVVVGHKPDVHKTEKYTYDTIIRLSREKGKKGYVYKAEILKDRTKVYKAGDIIDGGVSFENWREYFEKKNKGGKSIVATNYKSDIYKDEKFIEEEDAIVENTLMQLKKFFKAETKSQGESIAKKHMKEIFIHGKLEKMALSSIKTKEQAEKCLEKLEEIQDNLSKENEDAE